MVKERTMPSLNDVAAAKPAKSTRSRKAGSTANEWTHAELEAMPSNEVWELYHEHDRPVSIRNYFWQKYSHLVRYIADRTYARLPNEVDVGDLISAGQFGLMDAIDLFDLSRGVKFETFCATRIRGAILDELRAMDWVPRLVRSRTAKISNVKQKFEMAEGRAPTDEEMQKILGVNDEEFEKIKGDSRAAGTISLTRKCFQSDGNKDVLEIDVIKDNTQRNPLAETQRRDIRELITKGLSRAERLIIILYYYEEMTMKEIGATLDLSESRVSQMHSSILARLKAQMQHRERELEPVED
jgi:RNA polymerase sigma factor for flagellar operon FliA